MTRNLIVAALVLSPLMVHAQANTSAQPQVASSAPGLQSGLVQPKGLMVGAVTGSGDRTTPKPDSVRISTGVVVPKLVKTVAIEADARPIWWQLQASDRTVVLALVVDEAGKPSDVKIVRSISAALDNNVLSAVKQYRFEPGTVSGQPVAFPLTLEIELKHAGE